jgi:NADH dehydrogenase FAD-containing subunit
MIERSCVSNNKNLRMVKRSPVDVLLIDRSNHHVLQPLLYQVATNPFSCSQSAKATADNYHERSFRRHLFALNLLQVFLDNV